MPAPHRALVPVLVFIGFMVALVSSLGAPLVPTIAATDHVSLTTAQWSLTVTLLAGAIASPVLGRLSDGPHRRRVVLGTLAAVVVGSLLAAAPLGFTALVLGRGLQGLGLALVPLAMAVARDHLPPEKGRSTIALLSVSAVGGVGLGYPVTGLVAEHGGIHVAFTFGALVSALAFALAYAVIPASTVRSGHPLDALGAVLLGLGVAGLLVSLADAEDWGWTSARLLGISAGSLVLLAVWVVHELRTAHPLVDLRLLRHRGVLTANLTGILSGIGMYLLMSMVIRLVQTPQSTGYGFGETVAVGGLVLLPLSLMSVAASRIVPLLARRFSYDVLLPLGSLTFVAALVLFAAERSALWEVLLVMGVTGLGLGIMVAAMPALILRSVPASETGSATSFNQVLRTIGYATGSALSATVLQAHTPAGAALPTDSGYTAAAVLGAAIGALAALVAIVLPRWRASSAGQAVAGVVDADLLAQESMADALGEEDVPYVRSGRRR